MFGETARQVVLQHGVIDDTGTRHRVALLRPLSGWQEAALGAAAGSLDAASRSELLAACLERLGGYGEVSPELCAALPRGDQDLLALHLRVLMFGDRVDLTVRCPNPDCGELADLGLPLAELLPDTERPLPERIAVDTPSGPAILRRPTAEDDALVEQLGGDRASRSAALWSRLLLALGEQEASEAGPALTPEEWAALPPATRQTLALALGEDPCGPELSFASRCPSCRAWIELELVPIELLARELARGADRLLVELHCLAFHYGWSEDQCLSLPRDRRWRYLELLTRQLEGKPLLDAWS